MKPYLSLLNEVVAAHNQSVYFHREGDGRIWELDIHVRQEENMKVGTIQIIEASELPPMFCFDFVHENDESNEISAKGMCMMLINEGLMKNSKEIVE